MIAAAAMPEPILETQLVETQLVAPARGGEAALAPPFTVGGVVAKTVQVWWKHVLAFTAMSFVVYTPLAAALGAFFGVVASSSAPGRESLLPELGIAAVAVWVLTIALAVVQAGAVTFGTVRHLAGERAGLGEMLRVGFRRGLPVIAVGLLLWLGIAFGMLLLVVPGVLFMVATCVAIPAAVVERTGTIGAIRRSFALTRGYRWSLFAAGFAILVIVWLLAALVQVGGTVAASALLPEGQAVIVAMVASQLGNAFFSALPLVGFSVAYHELRVAKEGLDTAALAKVFE